MYRSPTSCVKYKYLIYGSELGVRHIFYKLLPLVSVNNYFPVNKN